MPTTFDRSLHTVKHDKLEGGTNIWDNNRSIWQDNPAVTEQTRPTTIRQSSSSNNRFSKSSTGSALSTIENPRTALNEPATIWGTSKNGRQSSAFTSPTKSKGSGWLFDRKSHDAENVSSLLAGSAPEFEPFGKENAPAQSRSLRLSDDGLAYDSRFAPSLRSTGPAQLPAPNRSLNSVPSHGGAAYSGAGNTTSASVMEAFPTKAPLYGLGMNTSPTLARGATRSSYMGNTSGLSSNTSRFARQASGFLDRSFAGYGNTAYHLSDLDLNKKPPMFNTHQSMNVDIDRNVYVVQDELPQGRLDNIYESENYYDAGSYYPQEYATDAPQPWNPSFVDQSGKSRLEFQAEQHSHPPVNSGYYSASLTPTSGTESYIDCSATSQPSYNDLLMANRKLGTQETYATFVHNSVLDMALRGYGGSVDGYAQTYPYYSAAGGLVPRELRPTPVRSAVLEDFRMYRTTNKRYELRDVFGHIVEFSGDRDGSRFIQHKLETANSDDKEQVFKEIQTNAIQLMTDIFGNYVIQKMFEHGNQSQKRGLADAMKGHVEHLSKQMYGCRVVQKALEFVLVDQQASIIQELNRQPKFILDVIRDQNGNHVVQKAIERVPAEHIQFIVEAHRGDVVKLAQHAYGCRVIQRILEFCTPSAKRVILDEVLTCLTPLIVDAYGNYVVQHVIEKGEKSDRRRVVETMLQQLLIYSKHKFASNVVEMCLQHAEEDQRTRMMLKLTGLDAETGQTPVLGLLRDQYGNYVIQKVFKMAKGMQKNQLEQEMHGCFFQLKRTSYGKQIVAIEKLLYGGTSVPALSGSSGPPSPQEQEQAYQPRQRQLPPPPPPAPTQQRPAQMPAQPLNTRGAARHPPQIQFGNHPIQAQPYSHRSQMHHQHQYYHSNITQHKPMGIATR